jgi:phosphoribosyl 1,2-cyclic phosphodiesterase|tara:strand:+ start:328 stop:1164 length:837 start_codon:yes stop_codon:yes gene_type:complete
MTSRTNFEITFWGVRGSVPTPAQHTRKYGGNTPCLEVRAGNNLLLIDAGTGICRFTERLTQAQNQGLSISILLSHTHWDHIQGLPFFKLAFNPANNIKIYGPKRPGFTLRSCLEAAMTPPNFPIPFDLLAGIKEVIEIAPGEGIELDGVKISTAELNHPDGSIGFRIEHNGKSLAYCLDHEHEEPDQVHPGLRELAENSDVLIFDAAYSDEDYAKFKGWGHSTWQVGHKTAQQLGVKTLVLSGFNPDLTDDELDAIAEQTKDMTGNTIVAKEGETLAL